MRDIGNPAVCIDETLSNKRGIVDLWFYFHEPTKDAALLAVQTSLLTPDELLRCQGFRFEADQRAFIAARALVRTVLSRYAPVPPGDWRFETEKHGKPRIAHPKVLPALNFNLAHTAGVVVCAVSVAHAVLGVDVEQACRDLAVLDLADRYFSAAETGALRALPASGQRRRFLSIWTLKESYVKARGLGLSLPLDKFSFFLGAENRVAFEPEDPSQDATRWQFALLDIPPSYIVAVAADTDGAPLSLRFAPVIPLRRDA